LLLFVGLLLTITTGTVSGERSAFADDGTAAKKWLCKAEGSEAAGDDDAAAADCLKDLVIDFPGWTERQPLPSPWFSGYLKYELEGRTVHTHYVLVLAEKHHAMKKQPPLIYWSNGGPGASSLFGLMAELGPLVFSDKSKQTDEYRKTGIPTPIYNPYNWAKLGHLLIFDQPAPVGFSYCEPQNSTTTSNNNDDMPNCAGLSWTDELASANTYAALQAFYKKYPKFFETDLYLTGESYAGIYIPTLAREILNGNNNNDGEDAPATLPLQGFAVGDGCLGTETGLCKILDEDGGFDFWLVLFLAGHNQIPLHTFQEVIKACKPFSNKHEQFKGTDICKAAVAKVRSQVGGVYDYSLYDECTYSNGLMEIENNMEGGIDNGDSAAVSMIDGALNDYSCGGDVVMEEYLKLDAVREALHVQESDYFSVDNAENFDYTPTEKDLTGFYNYVATETNISVLVYNGDVDPAITSFAAQNWTSHLGLHKTEDWRPWTVDGCRRMGGYVTRYEGMFDFLTIRGAGHMVPTYKAAATFTFLQSWLHRQDYPAYVANCTAPPTDDDNSEQPPAVPDFIHQEQQEAEAMKKYVRTAA